MYIICLYEHDLQLLYNLSVPLSLHIYIYTHIYVNILAHPSGAWALSRHHAGSVCLLIHICFFFVVEYVLFINQGFVYNHIINNFANDDVLG